MFHRNIEGNTGEFISKFDALLETKMQSLNAEYLAAQSRAEAFKLSATDTIKVKQQTFLEVAEALHDGPGELSAIEKRLLQSDIITLYHMLVDGYLDEKVAESQKINPTSLSAEDSRRELAAQIILKARKTNQEEVIRAQNERVTVGIEIETPNASSAYMYTHDFEEPPTAEAILTKAGAINSNIEQYRHGNVTEGQLPPSASTLTTLRDLQTLKHSETAHTHWATGLGIHETFAGVELSPDHLESMDFYALEIGAGLIRGSKLYSHVEIDPDKGLKSKFTLEPNPNALRAIEANLDKGIATDYAYHRKPSKVGGKYYYFPRHKARQPEELTQYTGSEKPTTAIERRTSIQVGREQFPLFARELITAHMGMKGVETVQQKTGDSALSDSYQAMMEQWDMLLTKYGVQAPSKKEYYLGPYDSDTEVRNAIQAEVLENESGSKNPYELFINQILVTGAKNPEFRKKAMEIIIEYRSKMRALT